MIELLFPKYVITEESALNASSDTIYPEEAVFIEKAVQKRKDDFISGRLCAKIALSKLGINNFPILMASDRSPVWPEGIVGSISHTSGFCGVVVARTSDTKSLGLDIECVDRLKKECWYLTCTENEQSTLDNLSEYKQKRLAALIFSAKECFYKCQYFLNREWAGFHDAEIIADVGDDKGEFEILMLKDIGNYFKKGVSYKGNFSFDQGYVITGMTF